VVEHHRARYDVLVIAVEINDDAQDQRGKTDRLDDCNQRVIAEVAHDGAVHANPDEQRDCDDGSTDK
nr:hypothetical protein [Tanacetum cinerariifolium]